MPQYQATPEFTLYQITLHSWHYVAVLVNLLFAEPSLESADLHYRMPVSLCDRGEKHDF